MSGTAAALAGDQTAPLAAMADIAEVPGLCVALARPDGEAIFLHGEDERGSGRPVDRRTWFQAASTGKHVTACVILELAAAGRIDLDAPIGGWLEGLPPAWKGRSIGSLLHHTSGLPEYLLYTDDEIPPTSPAAFFALCGKLEPVAPEGAAWAYSNTNYILLGLLAQAVTGQTCGRLCDDLFARLGIAGAKAASPDWARAANAGRVDPLAADADSIGRAIFGDGDIAFTAEGALAWLRALLSGRTPGAAGTGGLFAPAQVRDGSVPYGCGWFLERLRGAPLAHHAGHYDGWTAMALLNLARGSGVFALCNLAPGSTRAIRSIALRALENFDPGATPLALSPVRDDRPDLTANALRELVRESGEADPAGLAPQLALALGRNGNRGMLNLWCGERPAGFAPVEDDGASPRRTRRYRLSYAGRVEHLCVETDAEDRIAWAWPL